MGLSRRIFYLFAAAVLALTALSCRREPGSRHPSAGDDICNQMVLFSSGNVSNEISKAPATPYMAQNGRFVCTMYYKSGNGATEESDFDIDGGTSVLTWMSVNNTFGNSVYRLRNFRPLEDLTPEQKQTEAYKTYGFDPDAEFFYWKNRLSHVFVAYADYNRLSTNTWAVPASDSRALFMYPENNGSKTTYEDGYEYHHDNKVVIGGTPEAPTFNITKDYILGEGMAVRLTNSKWYAHYEPYLPDELKAELTRTTEPEILDADGYTYQHRRWFVAHDDDLANSIVYSRVYRKVKNPVNSPANVLDLRRSESMTRMEDQPDPILAVTIKKPEGSSQETNRVNLYFRHQFSQIQVNLKVSTESASEISAANILSVELLGVSETGYVFTYVKSNGDAIPADYLPVSVSASQAADNPYGTSFNMFVMPQDQTPSNSVKSFNAIAFGMLEAIRIRWTEQSEQENQFVHSAIMKVDKDEHQEDLRHLQSGIKYIYDIELQRSTVTLLRTHLVDWKLDDDHQFTGNGTVSPTQPTPPTQTDPSDTPSEEN